MTNIFKFTTLVFASLLVFTTSCIDENYEDSPEFGTTDKALLLNALNTENGSGDLDIFLKLAEDNGITGVLTSRRIQDQRTVFAPTNNAFEILAAQLGYDSVEDMLQDDADDFQNAIFNVFEVETNLLEIVENHVSSSNLTLQQIQAGSFRKIGTLSGVNIPVNREDGGLIVNNDEDLEVVRSNTEGNGTVHIVSRVLMPVKFIEAVSWNFGADPSECSVQLGDWTVVNVELQGGSGWACTGFGFEGQALQANGYDDGAQTVDSWIISPELSSEDVILNTLKFKYASRFGGPNPEIYVIKESDYADDAFSAEDWTKLDFNFPAPASGNGVFSDQAVRIPSDIHSGAYRIAFRYISGDGATRVTIDNIEVGEE